MTQKSISWQLVHNLPSLTRSFPFVTSSLGILMENLGALDFSENIQSSRVFYADSRDTAIVGLPQHGGGVDTKRP
jgi:hypothetical protein